MSLFRPDRVWEDTEFVPLRFEAAQDDFISESPRSGLPESGTDASAAQGDEALGGRTSVPDEGTADGAALHYLSEAQLEEIEAAAYARGEAAAQQAALAFDGACAAIEKAGLELARSAASQLAANREGTLALAAEMARAWVGEVLRTDSQLFAEVLEGVLVEMGATEEAQVFLNPEALESFASREEPRLQSWVEKFGVLLRVDPALAPAEFRVESPMNHVDGRLEAIRDRLITALSSAVEAAPPEGER
jgi:hypothetical protein